MSGSARWPLRVVKVGGSLFDWPELSQALGDWLRRQSAADTLLVAGGGDLSDFFRRAAPQHGLTDATGHWLCVRAMQATAEFVGSLLPTQPSLIVPGRGDWPLASEPSVALMDAWNYLRPEARPEGSIPRRQATTRPEEAGIRALLPANWSVTSDSIAAAAAVDLGAAELVLLKSCLPDGNLAPREISRAGYVDEFFSELAEHLPPVRLVNLRAEGFPQRHWQRAEHTA